MVSYLQIAYFLATLAASISLPVAAVDECSESFTGRFAAARVKKTRLESPKHDTKMIVSKAVESYFHVGGCVRMTGVFPANQQRGLMCRSKTRKKVRGIPTGRICTRVVASGESVDPRAVNDHARVGDAGDKARRIVAAADFPGLLRLRCAIAIVLNGSR